MSLMPVSRRARRLATNRSVPTLYGAPKPKAASAPTPLPVWSDMRPAERPDESVSVLSLGEAAARLGVSCPELEAMIDAGKIEALPTGFTRMIPGREVVRFPVASRASTSQP